MAAESEASFWSSCSLNHLANEPFMFRFQLLTYRCFVMHASVFIQRFMKLIGIFCQSDIWNFSNLILSWIMMLFSGCKFWAKCLEKVDSRLILSQIHLKSNSHIWCLLTLMEQTKSSSDFSRPEILKWFNGLFVWYFHGVFSVSCCFRCLRLILFDHEFSVVECSPWVVAQKTIIMIMKLLFFNAGKAE